MRLAAPQPKPKPNPIQQRRNRSIPFPWCSGQLCLAGAPRFVQKSPASIACFGRSRRDQRPGFGKVASRFLQAVGDRSLFIVQRRQALRTSRRAGGCTGPIFVCCASNAPRRFLIAAIEKMNSMTRLQAQKRFSFCHESGDGIEGLLLLNRPWCRWCTREGFLSPEELAFNFRNAAKFCIPENG